MLSPGYVVSVGERFLFGNDVVVGIDRVCPMCMHMGPPYSALLKFVGESKADFRICHECKWHTKVTSKKTAAVV
jgi:hypothetical protein